MACLASTVAQVSTAMVAMAEVCADGRRGEHVNLDLRLRNWRSMTWWLEMCLRSARWVSACGVTSLVIS